MAYLALYRTFRPTHLSEVVRQEHIVTVLKNQIQTGRVGHAYLFCGPRGTGKTSIAKIFAAAINCESPVNGSSCGSCATCRALKDPSNLDISEIDAASNNGVEEMRDLREKVQYPPVAGKYKVYIIDEVHMLSTGAFNALLKTLEEPPSHAVFILATTEAHKIPATILSRCMRFDFKLIPQEDLEKRLKFVFDEIEKPYEEEAVVALARAGAGSVRDMLSLADTCLSYSTGKLTYKDVTSVIGSADSESVYSLLKAVLEGNAGEAFVKAEEMLFAGKSVGMLLKDLMNGLNACTIAKTCKNAQKLLGLPNSDFTICKAIADSTDGHTLLRATEIFAKVEPDLKYSTSPRVLFETAILKASMPQTETTQEALLSRIALLEKKLENGVPERNDGGRVEVKREIPAPPVYEVEPPPMEEPVYDEPVVAPPKAEAKPAPVSVSAPTAEKKEVKAAPSGDAKAVFGAFLRTLRRTGRNGVLFTICMDLDYEYDGDIFVLSTTSETMYRSLKKEDHYALVKQSFEAIGVSEERFDIRLRGKQKDEFQKQMNELKETFPNTKIEIK